MAGEEAKKIKFKVTVVEKTGHCRLGYEQGDIFYMDGLNTPDQPFCGGSYHILFPGMLALRFGANFPFSQEKNTLSAVCPDHAYVKYKIEKLEE